MAGGPGVCRAQEARQAVKHLAAVKAASEGLRNPPLVFAIRIKVSTITVCAHASTCYDGLVCLGDTLQPRQQLQFNRVAVLTLAATRCAQGVHLGTIRVMLCGVAGSECHSVAKDFATCAVDITTEDPEFDALVK
jgi:hypothetical protein